MPNEIQEYKTLCQKNNVLPNEEVVASLTTASETGELNLSRKTLSAWTWETLGRIIRSSTRFNKLNFSDCLIPPRGLTALLSSLRHDCNIDTLILRGNAVQASSVSYLGTLLRQNSTLKSLSLEWNSTGIFVDAFSQFCEGLAINKTLQFLDLKNNQLPPECGQYLGDAITRNSSLKTLDLRWNNLGWKGGHFLHEAMQKNQTLTKIKLTGNCMSDDLMKSIEQCAQHNGSKERIVKDCEMKTDFLKRHLKRLEEERAAEVQELSKSNEMRIRQVVKDSESRVTQLENVLTERASTIDMLQEHVTSMEKVLKQKDDDKKTLEKQLIEKDAMYQTLVENNNKEKEAWQKKLSDKDQKVNELIIELESKMAAELTLRKQIEIKKLTQNGEMERLTTESIHLSETLKALRKKHQESLAEEQRVNQDLLQQTEKRCEEKLNQCDVELSLVHSKYQNQLKLLEQAKGEVERSLSELRTQLNRERGQWQEDLAAAHQQAIARETVKLTHYEEKVNSLREEKVSLEKQLSLCHSTMTQLQQQNSSLVAELGEPQRRLSQLHEELSTERVTSQRIRAELSESLNRLEGKKQEIQKMKQHAEDIQKKMNDLVSSQIMKENEQTKELEKFKSLLVQREREIQNIRADEVERAGVLYSAVSKYLGGLIPSQTSLRAS